MKLGSGDFDIVCNNYQKAHEHRQSVKEVHDSERLSVRIKKKIDFYSLHLSKIE